ncbi:RICIN domain-containing protein [Streptomyces sp. BA2]|uniref:RICIN domain-containing protein n=1 Tax=Streptomyces sp. BA2 TaxID=436595 RepID=UPI00132B07CF|nr:RICIN domain-containing protein [Streptomyces sp. BA2]MWA11449.1 family 43 glycosylhydrolase [Streptomyces sp. BA2]
MFRRARRPLLAAILAVVWLVAAGLPAHAAPVTVTNGTQFTDTTGAGVHAHGGGAVKVGDFYYWFGENRHADNTFKAVSVYRSSDLKTWEFRKNVLTQESDPELSVANIERPKVIYNSETRKFVMWMHKENGKDYTESRTAVAVSDTVDGDYSWKGSFRPPSGTTSRDMTLFKDDDGTAYQISSGSENADLFIYRLTDDYTAFDKEVANPWPNQHRESPALFKRDGVYFMLTSGTSGWYPNQQKYATAESITGPWSEMKEVGDATAYGSQTAYVLPVQGSSGTSYLYMGDRWGNSMGGTVNDSQYVWLPLAFPTRTTMSLPWYPELSVDTDTGTVKGVGGGPRYSLTARHSGKCLDVSDASSADGAAVVQYSCDGGLNQQWRLEDAGDGYVRVLAQHSGKCLDVADEATGDGAFVNQYRCGSGAHQQWRFEDRGSGGRGDDTYRLVSRHSGKCLDVADESTGDGARLVQWTCGNGANQQFKREVSSPR